MLPDHHVLVLLVGGHGRLVLVLSPVSEIIPVDFDQATNGRTVPAHTEPIDVVAGSGRGVYHHEDDKVLVHGDVVGDVHLMGARVRGEDAARQDAPGVRYASASDVVGHARGETDRRVEGVPDHQVLVAVAVPGHAGGPEATVSPGDDLELGVRARAIPGDDPAPDLVDVTADLFHPHDQVFAVCGVVRHGRPEAVVGAGGDAEPTQDLAAIGHAPGIDVPAPARPLVVPDHQVLLLHIVIGHGRGVLVARITMRWR